MNQGLSDDDEDDDDDDAIGRWPLTRGKEKKELMMDFKCTKQILLLMHLIIVEVFCSLKTFF